LVVLASTLAYAVEPLVLYDDFNAGQLAQDKWVSGEEGAGTEPTVQIQDNRLRLFNRIYGKTDSDHGKDAGSLLLAFSNSAAVTAIKATVQVNDVRVYGCPSNPLRSEAVTFLGGSFFNTATPTPGSDVHDVWAAIGLVRNSDMRLPPDVFSAISLVGHCTTVTNATCKDSTWLHSRGLGPGQARGEGDIPGAVGPRQPSVHLPARRRSRGLRPVHTVGYRPAGPPTQGAEDRV